MTSFLRTDSNHSDFRELVALLDRELAVLDGDDHAFYAQYNKIDMIRNALVCYQNGKPVACGAFKFFGEGAVEVKRMYVLPELRNRGIASQVLAELERWAAELGYGRCVLETGRRQPDAIRLYEKGGYAVIPNYGQYVGMENSLCMEKRLV